MTEPQDDRCFRLRDALWLTMLLMLAIGLRMLLIQRVDQDPDRAMTPDSYLYYELGKSFTAAYIHNEPAYMSGSARRTPGYPAFCATMFTMLGESIRSVLLGQVAVAATVILLLYVTAIHVAGRIAAVAASFLYAFDPLSITSSAYVLSETTFTLALFAGWLFWYQSLQKNHRGLASAAGLCLSGSVLIRPVTLYILPFVLLADWALRGEMRNARMQFVLAMATTFLLPLGAHIWRNHKSTGHYFVSTIEGINLLYYRAAGAVAAEQGLSRIDVETQWLEKYDTKWAAISNPAERSSLEKKEAIPILLAHPRGVIVSAITGATKLLIGPGYKSLSRLLHGKQRYSASAATSWVIQLIQTASLLIVYLLCFAGMRICYRQGHSILLVSAGVVVVYLILVSSGPEAYSRFRVPLMPFFCLFAGVGLASIFSKQQTAIA